MVPVVEQEMVVNNGIILLKYFLDVSQDEQRRRFEARIKDPNEHWKLSPMDTELVRRCWDQHGGLPAQDPTHTPWAPWHIVPAHNKRRARLNLIRDLLKNIPYKKVHRRPAEDPQGATRRPRTATEGLSAGQPIPSHHPKCPESASRLPGIVAEIHRRRRPANEDLELKFRQVAVRRITPTMLATRLLSALSAR